MRNPFGPLALVSLATLALAACSDGQANTNAQAQEARPRAVVVHEVAFAPRQVERTFVGTVRPRIESDLGFRVAGKIAERLVNQGDRVAAGQPLYRLDPTDLDLQRAQALAERDAATQALASAEAQVRRSTQLRRDGWTTQAVLDNQTAQAADARGRLERARRALDLAENQSSYALLAADVDGVVTATLAEPGQVVAAGTPVARLARAGEREAVVAIPESLIERVRAGEASVTLWSASKKPYAARLRELAASADPATRTFQARFTILEPDEAVVIGMTATVSVGEPASARVARLPISALFAEGRGPAVYVVNEATGSLTLKPVEIAGYDGAQVLIASGIVAGERVVAFGVQKLDTGQRVRVVETRR